MCQYLQQFLSVNKLSFWAQMTKGALYRKMFLDEVYGSLDKSRFFAVFVTFYPLAKLLFEIGEKFAKYVSTSLQRYAIYFAHIYIRKIVKVH